MQRHWIFAGAILAGLAVVLGAFAAHGLDGYLVDQHGDDLDLVDKRIGDWKTGALYHMHHAIGIILVGIVSLHWKSNWLVVAGWCFLAGITLFSGMLYVLVLTEIRILGAIVPIGGVSFILGWIALGVGGCCMPAEPRLTQLKDG